MHNVKMSPLLINPQHVPYRLSLLMLLLIPFSTQAQVLNPAPPQVRWDLPSVDLTYASHHQPVYPYLALLRHHKGTVIVLVTIDATGAVTDTRVNTSSNYPELDKAAVDTVKNWKYFPGRDSAGMAQKGQVLVPVTFGN
jgi:periplasmic protein TonB